MANEYFLRQPAVTEMMARYKNDHSIREVMTNQMNGAGVSTGTEVWSQVSGRLPDHAERCAFLEKVVGMSFTQKKRVFVLKSFQKSTVRPGVLTFQTRDRFDREQLLRIVSAAVDASLDREFRIKIEKNGLQSLANETLWSEDDCFGCEDDWFQIGIFEGQPVGFVFPVKFNGCDKDGLIEGTIFNIGVLPEFRGRGFGKELLTRACGILDGVGMWRIFCDTDSENVPMIRAFRSVGFEEIDEITKYRMVYAG